MTIKNLTVEAAKFSDHFDRACDEFGIVSPLERAHLAAQCAHESGGFKRLEEDLRYSAKALLRTWPNRFSASEAASYERNAERIGNRAYAGRMGNGNEASGDGYKYRGMGLIQTTGKRNVTSTSRALLGDDSLVQDPSKLKDPELACRAAAYFWTENGIGKYALADDIEAVSGMVNRGSPKLEAHGINLRKSWLKLTKKAYGIA